MQTTSSSSSSGNRATVGSHLNSNTTTSGVKTHHKGSHDDEDERRGSLSGKHPFTVSREQKINFPDFDRAFQENTEDSHHESIAPPSAPENLNLSIEEIAELRAESFPEEQSDENYNVESSISDETDKENVDYFGDGKHSISILKTPEGRGQSEQDKYALLRSRETPKEYGHGIAEPWAESHSTQRRLFDTPPKERKQVFLSPFSSLPQVFMSPQRIGDSEVVYTDEGGNVKENNTPDRRRNQLPPRSSMSRDQSQRSDANAIGTPCNENNGDAVLDDWAISPIGPPSQEEYVQIPVSERFSFEEQAGTQRGRGGKSKSVSRLQGMEGHSRNKDDNVSVSLMFSAREDHNEVSQASQDVSSSSTLSSISSTISRSSTQSSEHDSTVMSVSILPSLDAMDFSDCQNIYQNNDVNCSLGKEALNKKTPSRHPSFKSREEPRVNCVSSTSNPVASPAWNASSSGSSFSSDRSSPSKAYKLWKLRRDVEEVKTKYRGTIHSPLH